MKENWRNMKETFIIPTYFFIFPQYLWPRLQKPAPTSSYLNFVLHFLFIYWIDEFSFHSKRKMRLLSFFWNENRSHWGSGWKENANQSLGVMTSEPVSVDGVTFTWYSPHISSYFPHNFSYPKTIIRGRARNFSKSHRREEGRGCVFANFGMKGR